MQESAIKNNCLKYSPNNVRKNIWPHLKTRRVWYIVNHNACFRLFVFLTLVCSQGSVATHLRYGEIFHYRFPGHLLLSLSVDEFWKSVSIWHRYNGTLFRTWCRAQNSKTIEAEFQWNNLEVPVPSPCSMSNGGKCDRKFKLHLRATKSGLKDWNWKKVDMAAVNKNMHLQLITGAFSGKVFYLPHALADGN